MNNLKLSTRSVCLLISIFTSLLCYSISASSEYQLSDDWVITAFGTLGYTDTDKYDDLVIKREISQRSHKVQDDGWRLDSRLGIQLSGNIDRDWTSVFQVLAQEKAQNDLDNSITIAFLKYQSQKNWGYYLGRIPFDLFLLSDHRNVGYSYHWTRPPGEFYGWIPFSYFDGVKGYYEFGDFDNFWRIESFVGRTLSDINIGYSGEENIDADRTLAIASPALGVSISWESGDFRVRLSAARMPFTENTLPNQQIFDAIDIPGIDIAWPEANDIAEDIALKGSFTIYTTLGASWKPGPWLIQGEVSDGNHSDLSAYDGQRVYISVGRRFGQILPHITYSRAWDDREFDYDPPTNPAFLPLYAVLEDAGTSLTIDQYTWSVGVRWDVDSQKALKLQCDYSTINRNSLGLYSVGEVTPIRDWRKDSRNWCSANFDWVF